MQSIDTPFEPNARPRIVKPFLWIVEEEEFESCEGPKFGEHERWRGGNKCRT